MIEMPKEVAMLDSWQRLADRAVLNAVIGFRRVKDGNPEGKDLLILAAVELKDLATIIETICENEKEME